MSANPCKWNPICATLCFALAACTTTPATTSTAGPSNPAAPEGPPIFAPAALGPTTPIKIPALASPAGNTLFTCVMHPQILQDHAGTCPICGMALIPASHGAHP